MQRRAPIILIPAPWGRHSTLKGSKRSQTSVRPTVKMALAGLGLDVTPVQASPQRAFSKKASQSAVFHVPPSAPYIEELLNRPQPFLSSPTAL